MTFLNPSVLIGLLAGLIPIALHFINMRKLKRVEFSTLYFMKELRKTKIRKLKFKQLLLLLLRLLIIISLVIAFAKPAVKSQTPLGGERAKKTAVFILDDSPSMSVLTNNGTLFNNAKKIISDLLNNYTDDDILFLLLTSEPENNTKTSTNKVELIKTLKHLELTSVAGSLSDKIKMAINKTSEIKTLKKDVFVLSDFNKNILSKKEFSKSIKSLDENSQIFLIPFNSNVSGNLSLKSFSLSSQLISIGAPIKFSASITNSSLTKSLSGNISIFINNKRIAQNSFTVKKGNSINLNLNGTLTKPGFVESKAILSDDQLAFDNERYYSFYVKGERDILISAAKKSSADFLTTALSANKLLHSKISFQNISSLASENLSRFDALFIIGTPIDAVSKIKMFVQNGGGVVWFPSSDFNESELVQFLQSLNAGQYYGLSSMKSMPSLQFETIDFSSPLFEGLFSNKYNSEINSPEIKNHLLIKSNEKGNTIITLEDRSSFLSQYTLGKGNIFLFNVPPTLKWSNFPIKPIFAPIINRLVILITSGQNKKRNIIAGNEFKISSELFRSPTIKVVSPSGNYHIINSNELRGKKFFPFKKTYQSGFYNIVSNGNIIESFAVNISPTESDFTKYTNDELRKLSDNLAKNDQIKIVLPNDENLSNIKTVSDGQEFWRFFLALALIFAILEMIVARVGKKEILEFEGIK